MGVWMDDRWMGEWVCGWMTDGWVNECVDG